MSEFISDVKKIRQRARQPLEQGPVTKRIAVESYSEIIRWPGNDDPTTRKLLEDIRKKEEDTPMTYRTCSRPSTRSRPPHSSKAGRIMSDQERATDRWENEGGRTSAAT